MKAVQCNDLSVSYSDRGTVRDVIRNTTFDANEGTITALIGRNGSGKTTFLKVLAGTLKPTAGSIRLFGSESAGPVFRDLVGYLPQNIGLYGELTVSENISHFRNLYGTCTDGEMLMNDLGLTEQRDTRFDILSGGQKRRTALACVLVCSPRILVLDEPTAGLDPQARHEFWILLRKLRDQGMTIITTVHEASEACLNSDRVLQLANGRLSEYRKPLAIRLIVHSILDIGPLDPFECTVMGESTVIDVGSLEELIAVCTELRKREVGDEEITVLTPEESI